jgi:Tol biopolymer transport system component
MLRIRLLLMIVGLSLFAAGTASAASTRIVYTLDRGDGFSLYSVKPDGSGKRQVSRGKASEFDPAWSPNRRSLAFSRAGRLYTMHADGTHLHAVPHTKHASDPSWSPDGHRLAYVAPGKGNGDSVYKIRLDGRKRKRLTKSVVFTGDPDWSPNGKSIVYSDGEHIATIRPDGGHRTVIGEGEQPVWSPHGDEIAFSTGSRIAVMDPDGSNVRTLSDSVVTECGGEEECNREDTGPAWSPSGGSLAFAVTYDESDNGGLYTIRATGAAPKQIVRGTIDSPDW